MSEPTPGPWEIKTFDESQTVIYGPQFDGDKHELIAIVSVGRYRPHGEANARLIAAAPLMKKALEAEAEAQAYWATCIGGDVDAHTRELCEHADRLRRAALAASAPPPTADAGAEDGATTLITTTRKD